MNVFVAGGSGTIGIPLVRALVQAGHQVAATTRSPARQEQLRALGALPVVVDALDKDALVRAVQAASPTHVIHELTALPKAGPKRASELDPTNRLRDEGTRNLLVAAIAARATRFIGGSFALIGAAADAAGDSPLDAAAAAIRSMESQIVSAARGGSIEGIVLRYGLFYGSGNPSTVELVKLARRRLLPAIRGDRGQLPYIHLDDVVGATIAALERGRSGEIYDIVDDSAMSYSEMARTLASAIGAPRPMTVPGWIFRLVEPYRSRLLAVRLPLSNAKAVSELGWRLKYPSIREGLAELRARPA